MIYYNIHHDIKASGGIRTTSRANTGQPGIEDSVSQQQMK